MQLDADLERAKQELFRHLRRELGDDRVLDAMEQVPRHLFVPPAHRRLAYEDMPLPIGQGQTISQPFIVALMTRALELRESDRVLELGTGSGYQAAILAEMVPEGRVLSLERLPQLASTTGALLRELGYSNVEVRLAGKVLGCPEEAPFDAILVTAGAPRLPESLLAQLASGGRMVIPVGSLQEQELMKVVKTDGGHSVTRLGPCRFVPLIGEDAWNEQASL